MSPAAADSSSASPREQLARLAQAAALEVDGVADLQERPVGGPVSVIAGGDGRYGIRVRVAAETVPLPALADAIRAAITEAASRAGLEDELGGIDVEVGDIVEPGGPR